MDPYRPSKHNSIIRKKTCLESRPLVVATISVVPPVPSVVGAMFCYFDTNWLDEIGWTYEYWQWQTLVVLFVLTSVTVWLTSTNYLGRLLILGVMPVFFVSAILGWYIVMNSFWDQF